MDLSKAAPPRAVFPGAPVANSPPAKSAAGRGTDAAVAANPPSAIGEPRRVRTVPIRPDQGGDAAPAAGAAADVGRAAASGQRRSRQRAASAGDPRRRRVRTPRASSRGAASGPCAGRPMRRCRLSPDANNAPAAAAGAGQLPAAAGAAARRRRRRALLPRRPRVAAAIWCRCRRRRAKPTRESAYRSIQSKYSSVLGSQPAHRPPRRPRRQGRVLPRHGRAVRQPRSRRSSFAAA